MVKVAQRVVGDGMSFGARAHVAAVGPAPGFIRVAVYNDAVKKRTWRARLLFWPGWDFIRIFPTLWMENFRREWDHEPGREIAAGDYVQISTTGWNTLKLNRPVYLEKGGLYWLVFEDDIEIETTIDADEPNPSPAGYIKIDDEIIPRKWEGK